MGTRKLHLLYVVLLLSLCFSGCDQILESLFEKSDTDWELIGETKVTQRPENNKLNYTLKRNGTSPNVEYADWSLNPDGPTGVIPITSQKELGFYIDLDGLPNGSYTLNVYIEYENGEDQELNFSITINIPD
ncbi:MAG: hypothetical protein SNJ78_09860 [Spirochaetales bacterium]